jgi:hypothetical protein
MLVSYSAYSFSLKMEMTFSSETSLDFQQTILYFTWAQAEFWKRAQCKIKKLVDDIKYIAHKDQCLNSKHYSIRNLVMLWKHTGLSFKGSRVSSLPRSVCRFFGPQTDNSIENLNKKKLSECEERLHSSKTLVLIYKTISVSQSRYRYLWHA